MPFRGTNVQDKSEFSSSPNWLGYQSVAFTDVVDRSSEYENMDMFLEIYFKNQNSEYPFKYALLGSFDFDTDGNVNGDSGLLKRIVYFCDALGWDGGVNKKGQWVDGEDKEIEDIASYLNLNFTAANYDLKKDEGDLKYFIYVYKKYNEKAGQAYTTVCPKVVPNDTKSQADLESYVDWMKANKYIVEHDEKAPTSNGTSSTAASSPFDKF